MCSRVAQDHGPDTADDGYWLVLLTHSLQASEEGQHQRVSSACMIIEQPKFTQDYTPQSWLNGDASSASIADITQSSGMHRTSQGKPWHADAYADADEEDDVDGARSETHQNVCFNAAALD